MSFTFQTVFRPEPECGYTVLVPALPGCITYGATLDEAKTMAQEAIQLYVEHMIDNKEDVVDDRGVLNTQLEITLP